MRQRKSLLNTRNPQSTTGGLSLFPLFFGGGVLLHLLHCLLDIDIALPTGNDKELPGRGGPTARARNLHRARMRGRPIVFRARTATRGQSAASSPSSLPIPRLGIGLRRQPPVRLGAARAWRGRRAPGPSTRPTGSGAGAATRSELAR